MGDGDTAVAVAANQTVVNALLTRKLAIDSRAETQHRQELDDLKNLVKNSDRVVDRTTTMTATTSDEEVWV